MTVQGAPDLEAVKAWIGLDVGDQADDVVLAESLNAALAQQGQVVDYPRDEFGDRAFTDSLREAVMLRTQRLAARRNSPEGVVGLTLTSGDFVSARVPAFDSDVVSLEAPYRKIPVA
jgi:hypothetical protein